ncbi:putative gustatory receptor 28b [Frankliniella occidentalis]|uniref:Gustatory receptor 28b n=1 Tax=Frankliniella occidentalis TaxID=133901 RepID=A0A9C6TT13_FRAOC|nr:putative gustatory receptor 28b [Frankliniella occidentalis]
MWKLTSMTHMIGFGFVFINGLLSTQLGVIYACRSTTKEGNKTLNIVHDMMNCGKFTNSETHQLTLFSMQIGHQEVAVVPHGMFKMDISLLKSLFTTVIMYVIILVQFGSTI